MSYILEALKRADAERQRGAVPGLLASQVTTAPASVPSDGRRHAVWIAVAVLALGGLAVGLWRWRMPAPVPLPRVQTEAAPASVPVLAAGLPNAVVAASAQPSRTAKPLYLPPPPPAVAASCLLCLPVARAGPPAPRAHLFRCRAAGGSAGAPPGFGPPGCCGRRRTAWRTAEELRRQTRR
jgi:general secretion pathway protein B